MHLSSPNFRTQAEADAQYNPSLPLVDPAAPLRHYTQRAEEARILRLQESKIEQLKEARVEIVAIEGCGHAGRLRPPGPLFDRLAHL